MKLLLIQGANMEHLGRRMPELYGRTTAKEEVSFLLRRRARELGVTLEILYTNTEGEAVTADLQGRAGGPRRADLQPRGLPPCRSRAARLPESRSRRRRSKSTSPNIEKRGVVSVTTEAAVGMIAGFGMKLNLMALDAMVARLA